MSVESLSVESHVTNPSVTKIHQYAKNTLFIILQYTCPFVYIFMVEITHS